MPSGHAKLSASGSSIWLNCPASYSLTKDLPDVDTPFSQEGTRAHCYCEYLLRKEWLNPDIEEVLPDDKEMELCGNEYKDFVDLKIIEDWEDIPALEVEQKVDFSPWVPGGFGTCDCLIVCKDKLKIIDFKYGKGVKVEAQDNTQMQLYALGALNRFEFLDFETVEMTIFQPRIDNISSQTKTVSELLEFGRIAKRAADLALSEKGPAKTGKWCRFCKVNALCKARAAEPLNTIKQILEIGGKR